MSDTGKDAALVGHYRLLDSLGLGGQGRTYRAIDTRDKRVVAVKQIRLRGADGWKPFDLFERECRVLRSLDHPGIPRYVDNFAVEERGEFYLVMELVEGQSLGRLIAEQQPLSGAQVWNVLHQTLEILAYLHGRHPPVIHRDVKPDNLIRRPDGSIALVDFGGVRVALRPEGGSTVVGTFGYMAPEQLHGEATPATDIYGLGATIAALVSGRSADRLPRQGLRIDLASLVEATELREVLQQMLEPEPGRRLASVAAVRERLAAAERAAAAPGRGRFQRWIGMEGEAAEAAEEDDDRIDAENIGPVLARLVGSAGYVVLAVVEAIVLPLVFLLLQALSKPHDRRALGERRRRARGALRRGRRAMKQLSERRPPRRLPPPRDPPNRRVPPQGRHRRGGHRRLR